MNGPNKKPNIGLGLSSLQLVIFGAGLIVVLGLLTESGPETLASIKSGHWPMRQLIGSALVTIGVFLEVTLAIVVERSARRGELEAEERIAELNREVERLRKANDEAELMHSWRSIPNLKGLEDAMREFGNVLHFIRYEESEDKEPTLITWQLRFALRDASWISLADPPQRAWNLTPGVSIRRVVRMPDRMLDSESAAQRALAHWLDSASIAVRISAFQQDDLEPGTLIIEVGLRPQTLEKHRTIREEFARTKRPVTPPQA